MIKLGHYQVRETLDKWILPCVVGRTAVSGCTGVETVVDDAFQTLNNLDQRRHVGDFIQWRGLQLRQQLRDL